MIFSLFLEKINRIIRTKWEIFDEVEIALPTANTVFGIIADEIEKAFADVLVRKNNFKKFEKVFIFTEVVDKSTLALCYIGCDGKKEAVRFNLSFLKNFPDAVKKVELSRPDFLEDGYSLEGLADDIYGELVTADIVTLYNALPEKEKAKEINLICPDCKQRNTMYFIPYQDKWRLKCDNCDFESKTEFYKYLVLQKWSEKWFAHALKENHKKDYFKLHSTAAVNNIKTQLAALESLKDNKKAKYEVGDIVHIEVELTEILNQTIKNLKQQILDK